MLILVDEFDNSIGSAGKMEVHRSGLLHRAFSVLILNDKGEMLIHKRAGGKYHSGGLWTNACCSHPFPGEETINAAVRRVKEELGVNVGLKELFHFTYKANLDKGLIEHELDHVFIGYYSGGFDPDPMEIEELRFIDAASLEKEMVEFPEQFTVWFRILMGKIKNENISLE